MIKNGHLDVVKYLVERGADIHQYEYALVLTAEKGHLDIVKYLIAQGANIHQYEYALVLAAEKGHLDIVKYLVDHGANDVEAIDLAYKNGHPNAVIYLENPDFYDQENRLHRYLSR